MHRDVKPGNLLRSDDGLVKLADFGIAKALSDESAITQVGSVLGTAAYLAPEQAHGEEAGPRSDLYSLGVVTYQLLSGQLPYEASSLTELALMQQREAPPLLHELVSTVPPALSAAVDRALALDPGERYADADAMRSALMDGARGVESAATEATHVADAAPATSATRVARPATARARSRRAAPRAARAAPRPGLRRAGGPAGATCVQRRAPRPGAAGDLRALRDRGRGGAQQQRVQEDGAADDERQRHRRARHGLADAAADRRQHEVIQWPRAST